MELRLSLRVPLALAALAASLSPPIARADARPISSGDGGPGMCSHAEALYPSGLLPVDIDALVILSNGPSAFDPATRVSLARIEPDGSRTPLEILVSTTVVDLRITPVAPLEAGTTIVLSQSLCVPSEDRATETTYRVVAAIDAPATLGTIEVSPLYAANYERGERNRVHYVDVRLVLSEAARERAGFLDVRPQIDDFETGWSSLATDTPTRVHIDCGTIPPRDFELFAPGDHTVRYSARDRAETLVAEVSRVITLGCEDPIRVDPITGRALEPWERDYWDREAPIVDDASRPFDLDAGTVPTSPPGPPGAGCSVSHGAREPRLPLVVLAVALALVRLGKSSNRSTS